MATLIRSPRLSQSRRMVGANRHKPSPSEAEALTSAVPAADDARAAEISPNAIDTSDVHEHPSQEERATSSVALQQALERAEQAEQRITTLTSDLERLRESARQSGYEEGKRSGEAEGRMALEKRTRALHDLMLSIEGQTHKLFEKNEDSLVEIVYAAVTKIIGEKLVEPSGVRHAVLQVLNHVTHREAMVIRVAPDDHAFLTALSGELGQTASTTVELVADSRVELGGCILETPGGSLDGRLEVQLHNLKEALLAARARRRAEAEGS